MQTYIVFDLETNGIGSFRPPSQTITQIAFIKFNSDGEVLDQYSTVVKGATLVNSLIPAVKITMEQIRNEGVEPIVAYTRFLDAIDDDMIVYAHINNQIVSPKCRKAYKGLKAKKNTKSRFGVRGACKNV